MQDLFGTETMAELCVRQGRLADALAIYRGLVTRADDERQPRWSARLSWLEEHGDAKASAQPEPAPSPSPAPPERSVAVPPAPPERSLVVREPVRSGQIVHARDTDLIVLAPVSAGAQLMADGHIHIYAPLRGRAVAGVSGARDARIFCQRLEAELVGIDAAYVLSDDLPRALFGKPAQIVLEDGRCRVTPL
jgi:septum site-determining protein MinC